MCRYTARANGVHDRVAIAARCTIERLRTLTLKQKRTVIVMDCKGCELDLLRLDLVPGLSACDILVELHDLTNPNMQVILSRFAATHDITRITSVERDPTAYPALQALSAEDQRRAVAERDLTGMQQWAVMTSLKVHA